MQEIKFLIIEDDAIDREFYQRMLKQYLDVPYETFEVDNGHQALTLLQNETIDCILLDYKLPDIDGLELLKQIKKTSDKFIPIIMLTGQGDEDTAVKAMKQGVTDYVIKNKIQSPVLVKTIMNAIWNSKLKKVIHEQKKQLQYYAYYDDLTGLANRHTFEKMADRQVEDAKRFHHSVAALLIDIDNFTAINDSLGRLAGDEILIEISKRLTYILPKDAVLARLEDDEFAVLLTGENIDIFAAEVARKIIEKLAEPFQLSIHDINLEASVGIACYPKCCASLDDLLKNATMALSHAKQSGSGKFQFYSQDLNKIYQTKLDLEDALHNALSTHSELFLVYQPKYHLRPRKLAGFEIMLRWKHPKLGIISPMQFMPIADNAGLMLPLAKWLLDTASNQLIKLFKKYSDKLSLTLDINLSARQLDMFHIKDSMKNLLNMAEMLGHSIELALNEATIIQYIDKNVLQNFAGLSAQLIVSDFKVGYSPLAKLISLPITSFRIEASHIENLENNIYMSSVVKSLITLGNGLDINVIADGVKTESEFTFLLEQGCPQGQGLYFSNILDFEEMQKSELS